MLFTKYININNEYYYNITITVPGGIRKVHRQRVEKEIKSSPSAKKIVLNGEAQGKKENSNA